MRGPLCAVEVDAPRQSWASGALSGRVVVRGVVRPRTVRILYSRSFPCSVAQAYAWLTDYQDDDPRRTHAVQKTRRVVKRTKESVVFEAEIGIGNASIHALADIRLDPPDHWVNTFVGGPLAGSVYDYRLTPDPAGCRLVIVHDIRATRLTTWLRLLVGRGLIRREIHQQWEGFAASMQNDLSQAPGGTVAA